MANPSISGIVPGCLASPNLARQCRYGHRRAVLTYIYGLYLARAKLV